VDINEQEENIINSEESAKSEISNTTIENSYEANIENNNVDTEKKVSFGDAFIATLVDIITVGLISAIGLFIFNVILKVAGYYVKDVIPMFLIIYLIVTLLYTSIMESSKNADTIGKRVARLKLIKTQ
jgi:RDD family.